MKIENPDITEFSKHCSLSVNMTQLSEEVPGGNKVVSVTCNLK